MNPYQSIGEPTGNHKFGDESDCLLMANKGNSRRKFLI